MRIAWILILCAIHFVHQTRSTKQTTCTDVFNRFCICDVISIPSCEGRIPTDNSLTSCPIVACKCPYGVYYVIINGCKMCRCKARCPGNVKPLSITCGDGILRCPGNYECITHQGSKKGICCPIGKPYEPKSG